MSPAEAMARVKADPATIAHVVQLFSRRLDFSRDLQAGDRFRGMALHVPFVDALTTMLDETIPLTTNEWTQWGNPKESKEAYEYILSYSPYDNTGAMEYPALFITAGLNDPRVSYHEPAKWIARIRDVRTNDATLLMWCEMGAGHGGPSGRYDAWREEARTLTFLLTELGVTATPA